MQELFINTSSDPENLMVPVLFPKDTKSLQEQKPMKNGQ